MARSISGVLFYCLRARTEIYYSTNTTAFGIKAAFRSLAKDKLIAKDVKMDSSIIIGLLALFTIGIMMALAIFHFGYFLKDPRNRGAAKNALIDDGPSAHTEVRKN